MPIAEERFDKGWHIGRTLTVCATRETGNTAIRIAAGGHQGMRASYFACESEGLLGDT
jgi:hypothetical protein